ncbi:ubiquitin carboxyl-terminal hydrolase 27-like [Vicia villosa]|uniref:ubiquitin carboxyl-terminal hydrolase 27-like n=1 Tax=Vicia villosa TaxID=3911 RepID=UPI00273AABE8|nr:ubiquitin carboxyl-terminal hydrolase 27-like [Vicia villosa]
MTKFISHKYKHISNKFENFDWLPLSPVLSNSYTVRVGCTLVDCLKQFIVAEHIENYHYRHCWHNAAIKYLSFMEGDKVELGKLRRCSDEEFCDCQKTYNLENLPWSNRFSHALKQLNIARCPKILCIQLKRAHMNDVGESYKLHAATQLLSATMIIHAHSVPPTSVSTLFLRPWFQEDIECWMESGFNMVSRRY